MGIFRLEHRGTLERELPTCPSCRKIDKCPLIETYKTNFGLALNNKFLTSPILGRLVKGFSIRKKNYSHSRVTLWSRVT